MKKLHSIGHSEGSQSSTNQLPWELPNNPLPLLSADCVSFSDNGFIRPLVAGDSSQLTAHQDAWTSPLQSALNFKREEK